MAFSFQPFFPQSILSFGLVNAAVTTTTNLVQGGTNGTKIETLVATSNDTIDHLVTFSLNVGGQITQLCQVNVPANSGNLVALSMINLFGNTQFSWLPQDANGNKYLYLANNACSLVISANSANATAHAVVSISGQAANY